jgi:flagellar capping protein FliD
LQRFFTALQAGADDPTSIASRQLIVSEGHSLVDRFNTLHDQLTTIEGNVIQQMSIAVSSANGLLNSIASLNASIARSIGGSKSTVAITTDDGVDSIAELGLTVGSGVAGKDVAGIIDGVAAFGLGNVLLPELDSDPYGMKLTVAEGATGTSLVTFRRGFGGTMFQLIDAMITNNGLISNREANIERDLERLDDEQSRLDRRIEAYNARLLAQYSAMDAIVQSLNTTRDYLSNILKTLPYTSSDN